MESHIDLTMNYEQVKMKTYILSLQPATKVILVYISCFFLNCCRSMRKNIIVNLKGKELTSIRLKQKGDSVIKLKFVSDEFF